MYHNLRLFALGTAVYGIISRMEKKHVARVVHSVKHTWKHDKKGIFIGLAALVLILFGLLALWISTFKLPDLSSFNTIKVAQSTNIYDRTGTVLL